MAKSLDAELAARPREESEETKDEPYPAGATFTRPNRDRSRVYSVRLSARSTRASRTSQSGSTCLRRHSCARGSWSVSSMTGLRNPVSPSAL